MCHMRRRIHVSYPADLCALFSDQHEEVVFSSYTDGQKH